MYKSKFTRIACIPLLLIAIVLLFPLKDGASIPAAARNAVIGQIPPALDILAERHPIQAGLIRATLNQNGQLDTLAQAYIAAYLDQQAEQGQSPTLLESYSLYYAALFDKTAVQNKIADTIEQQFTLTR